MVVRRSTSCRSYKKVLQLQVAVSDLVRMEIGHLKGHRPPDGPLATERPVERRDGDQFRFRGFVLPWSRV